LQEGEPFKFPDLFGGEKQTEDAKSASEHKKFSMENEKTVREQWSQLDMPPWFR